MLDPLPLLENHQSRSDFPFLSLFRGCQHLRVGQEWQGARHRLVDNLAIREDDRLIGPLRNRGIMRDDQNGLSLFRQVFK